MKAILQYKRVEVYKMKFSKRILKLFLVLQTKVKQLIYNIVN